MQSKLAAKPKPALPTCFAPAERAKEQLLHEQHALLGFSPLAKALLDHGAGHVLILNSQRQIVAASEKTLKLLSVNTLDALLGLRPGEALQCSHSRDCAGGCGTSPSCRECGAVQAILAAINGHDAEQECRLLVAADNSFQAMDLRVTTTAFDLEGQRFVIMAITDISHEKRRRTLERVFFHDVLNLGGGIQGLLELMKDDAPAAMLPLIEMSVGNVRDLLEEVMMQRDLDAAEQKELKVKPSLVSSLHVLIQLISVYQAHPACRGRTLGITEQATIFELETDLVLLKRVLGNLIKNAAEASRAGDPVGVACWIEEGRAVFTVHNASVMPDTIQHQIFQRSFSTKGAGRGLGTYSVKLLTEQYLRGTVGFSSTPGHGTTFRIQLPLSLPD